MGHIEGEHGSLMPTSVSSRITSFLPFICIWDQLHFAAQLHVAKDSIKKSDFIVVVVLEIVLSQRIPLTLSQLTLACLLKKVICQ